MSTPSSDPAPDTAAMPPGEHPGLVGRLLHHDGPPAPPVTAVQGWQAPPPPPPRTSPDATTRSHAAAMFSLAAKVLSSPHLSELEPDVIALVASAARIMSVAL